MIQDYLMVNETTNIVDNVVTWDGNPDTWNPPQGFLMLVQATTPAMVWLWDAQAKDYVLQEQMGAGTVGFTWDGTACITNEPKPELPKPAPDQPNTTGTVTI